MDESTPVHIVGVSLPFQDVFWIVLKVFVATLLIGVILGTLYALLWVLLLSS